MISVVSDLEIVLTSHIPRLIASFLPKSANSTVQSSLKGERNDSWSEFDMNDSDETGWCDTQIYINTCILIYIACIGDAPLVREDVNRLFDNCKSKMKSLQVTVITQLVSRFYVSSKELFIHDIEAEFFKITSESKCSRWTLLVDPNYNSIKQNLISKTI